MWETVYWSSRATQEARAMKIATKTRYPLAAIRAMRFMEFELGTHPGHLVEEGLVVPNVVGRIIVFRGQDQKHRVG